MATNSKNSGSKKPASQSAAKKTASQTAAKKPASQSAAKKPTSQSAAKKPASQTAAKKPASQTAAKKPASQTAKSGGKASMTRTEAKTAYISPENKKKANGLRIGAAVLWLAAIIFEVLTILIINGTFYIPGNTMVYIIIGVVLDLICVIIGSQLWKKSNRLDPASEKNKIKFFLWNQMGVIVAVIAFFPLVLLLLKEDDLDEKTKKILTIIAAVAMLLSVGTSIDYNPVSSEELAAAQDDAYTLSEDGTAYWTTFGRCYHLNRECHTIVRSNNVHSGSIEDAFYANRSKPCSYCAVEEGEEVYNKDFFLNTSDSDIALEWNTSDSDWAEEIVPLDDLAA